MRPLTSAFLDLVRISAALGVVVSHVATSNFSRSIPLLESLGHASVATFFVLSGYVIAWTADTKENTAKSYLVARLSRIYSVLIPAVVFTLCFDFVSKTLDPRFFGLFVNPDEPLITNIFRTLLFFNESYGADHSISSDSPVWSLGYEVPYYLVFACVLFLRSFWRMILIVGIVLIEGPAVWILFHIWIFGVLVYRYIGRRGPRRSHAMVSFGVIVVLVLLSPWLMHVQTAMYGIEAKIELIDFGKSNQFIYFSVVGVFVGLAIVIVDYMSLLIIWDISKIHNIIQNIAASTFSIYLFHLPILIFIYSATHYDRSNLGVVSAVFFLTIIFSVLLSYISERRKEIWRLPISFLIDFITRLIVFSSTLLGHARPNRDERPRTR